MRVGVVGLGKLGLPVALALAHAGHNVQGWDVNANRLADIADMRVPEAHHEPFMEDYMREVVLQFGRNFVRFRPEVILICVQTPHQPQFEGTTPLTEEPRDFDYTYLKRAVWEVVQQIHGARDQADPEEQWWDPLLVVVSTCLPGTFERELRSTVEGVRFAYHPLFIAMGSVIPDFRDPEFLLCGTDGLQVPRELVDLYEPVFARSAWDPAADGWRAPEWCVMSITSAELTKVAYNAFIGFKLMLVNGLAMLADGVGADVDDVVSTLKLADRRLISTAYMRPGMGDAGACHPRDQIALSWLARVWWTQQPFDMFGAVIEAREHHARWLAKQWVRAADIRLPLIQLGSAYKPDTSLQVGSHALLLAHYAHPTRIEDEPFEDWPVATYFLATPHHWVLEAIGQGKIPVGSRLVDPWGYAPNLRGVDVIRPGRRASNHYPPPK